MSRMQYFGYARFKVLARLPYLTTSYENLAAECSAVEMEDRSMAWGEAGSDVDACASELRNAIVEAECQCNMDFDTCLMRGLMQALNNTCRGFDVVRRMVTSMMNDTSMRNMMGNDTYMSNMMRNTSNTQGKHEIRMICLYNAMFTFWFL